MRILLCLCFVSVLTVTLVGCDSGNKPASPINSSPAVSSNDALKARLDEMAKTGAAGSALAGMEEVIGKIEDATKRESLMKNYKLLSQANSPEEVKKLAEEMASQL